MKSILAKGVWRLISARMIVLAGFSSFLATSPVGQSAMAFPGVAQRVDTPAAGSQDLEDLYRQLAESCLEYEEGIESILRGDVDSGEQETVAARDRLVAVFKSCVEMSDCDRDRFFDAISELLDFRQAALVGDSTGVSERAPSDEGVPEDISSIPSFDTSLAGESGSNALLHGKELEDLIDLNDEVKAALNDWLTWMRPLLMEAYENYQYLRDKIAPIYLEAGLPEALLFALIATETGGKVHAYSRAGAAGLMQFMRYTGRRYGLRVADGFDMRLDPVASTKASVSYLNDQLVSLDRSLEKTLAAYNGGENRLIRLNRRLKGVSFWNSRFFNSLPMETRSYVPRIMAAAWLFLHPEEYNLQFKQYRAETCELAVKQDTSLDQLSICLGQEQGQSDGWFRTLRNLNPRLRAEEPVKAGEKIQFPMVLRQAYEQKCLEGELINRARGLHDAKYPEMIIYTVAAGDTLGKIASRHPCSSQEGIAAINNLRAPRYLIRTGQKLRIPSCR